VLFGAAWGPMRRRQIPGLVVAATAANGRSRPMRRRVADCYSWGMATMPTRIDQALFEAAKAAGELHSRSAAQQLDHWARVGRELEASPVVTHDEIARVLAGQASYDTLTDRAQAVVRVTWGQQMAESIRNLDLEGQLRATGQPWVEADADGTVVMREPGPAGA
jgi:hypothetical protein